MIDLVKETSERIFAEYLRFSDLKASSPQMAVAQSIALVHFPGALVPAVLDPSAIFVVAPSSEIWQRIAPLLVCRVGYTLSDFTGISLPVTLTDPVTDFLRGHCQEIVCQIQLSKNETSQNAAWIALARLVQNITEYAAQFSISRAANSVSMTLLNLESAAQSGDVQKAQELLDEMERNHQIDALNLNFLRVRLLALSEDWEGILKSGLYENLRHIRVPLPVQEALEKALLWQGVN